jgi:pyruvate/2-oxoacid:ferredoxin oxidoreductase alpha subunit/pyruvate/2-oxoacid:ferredoxin oxidoreductase beta subunit/Pyruvate/2-oxoacid:ferredoxin oxidoreductase gamma subunit/ferredoxin
MAASFLGRRKPEAPPVKYPGLRAAMDGNTAVIMCERESSDAAGAYPITPSTQMGEYWAEAAAAGHLNVSGRPLIFIEPEGEHAAAAVTAGLSMTGLRAANFSSGQGIAYMHESLYAAVGKRLTYVLNIGTRAMTKATLNVHAGHDDYHCIDDTGFFQLFARDAQSAADLNIIAHRIAELSLNPGVVAQDGFLTTHLIESLRLPERALIEAYLGHPDDLIDTPTPAQRIIYGEKRRRIPLLWDVDNPVMAGVVQNQDAYMQSVAAQRPFFFDHIQELADAAFERFAELTGRHYARVLSYRAEDADYLIVGQGSLIPSAEAVVDYLRETRGIRVGVVNLLMFRPFPADWIGRILRGKQGVVVLERLDQPLAVDLPLMREIRATLGKCLENGRDPQHRPHPGLEAYRDLAELPVLYSGSFGMGSRDLQPEGLIAAVENMLPGAKRQPLFYLSIDFVRDTPVTPKQEIYQQTIEDAYPGVKELALRGSENPNLMPEQSITVRLHSVGGWGAITTGKNLAMTLFDLLGYHIKANPKYGSEKKGQPTTYYLSAAPEPIRVSCEYYYVDVVLSPDPNVFHHTNALAGLREGGVFVIQSEQPSPEKIWNDIPPAFQKIIVDKKIRLFALDAFGIARDEATDPDLQLRMQGIRSGRGSPAAGDSQPAAAEVRHQGGARGRGQRAGREARLRRGARDPSRANHRVGAGATHPARRAADTGDGRAPPPQRGPADGHPSLLGADGQLLRAWHGQRQPHRSLHRARGDPGLLRAVSRHDADPLPAPGVDPGELHRVWRLLHGVSRHGDSRPGQRDRADLRHGREAAAPARRAARAPARSRSPRGAQPAGPAGRGQGDRRGGLLSITVNPYTCKGCMECVAVCKDDALRAVPQTDASVERLRRHWDLWLDLPTTPERYIRVDDLDQAIGALETILLDKTNYLSFTSGDGACLGCSEKTAIHLFIATVEALMRPRIARHVQRLGELIARLQKHIQLKLVEEIDVGDPAAMAAVLRDTADRDLTLAAIAEQVEKREGGEPIDQAWLRRVTGLLAQLEELRWKYEKGTTGRGRSSMGILNATGCTSVWGSTYPFNPYPYPWANHLFQDSPSMAMGVFEGHMAKMAEGFKAIRMAELELAGTDPVAEHEEFFRYFDWHQFSDEEWELCPPVTTIGGDGAMYDIGLQNLSRLMASGKPIKVLVVDTQAYSNTGGQACTSGFLGQISDMAQFGKAIQGKQEPRKEIGLIGMAHRSTYVLQSSIAHPSHMIEGFIHGLRARRPALFNIYSSCQPEHGIGDEMSEQQARLAVESRAYPLFRYDPDAGSTPQECFDLEGNPALEQDWPSYTLRFEQGGRQQEMELPLTFADFALTEVRFRKHFRLAPPDTWNDRMLPLAEFLELGPDEREDRFPYVWSVDRKQRLGRLLVDRTLVESSEDRRDFWHMLRALAGVEERQVSRADIEQDVRREVVERLASNLMQLASGAPHQVAALAGPVPQPAPDAAPDGDDLAPWIDTQDCTACDECIRINPQIFAYDENRKAFVKDRAGGPYRDLVRAAERCTARVIHPGLPRDRGEKDVEKWIARGQKYN